MLKLFKLLKIIRNSKMAKNSLTKKAFSRFLIAKFASIFSIEILLILGVPTSYIQLFLCVFWVLFLQCQEAGHTK